MESEKRYQVESEGLVLARRTRGMALLHLSLRARDHPEVKSNSPRCSIGPAWTAHPLPPLPLPTGRMPGHTPSSSARRSMPTASLICRSSAWHLAEASNPAGMSSWTANAEEVLRMSSSDWSVQAVEVRLGRKYSRWPIVASAYH